ncbi:MAG TPA: zf-HC2 domain-containing protein [Pseudonocardiaceae bacterium]|jgi:hypothetical protein|nr:zf-HC2 domain-containing protein [Pseudonocardiaceae bacterium]
MAELTCQQCREHAAELALGVLTGRERAGVLAHLDGCATCQGTVSGLTVTADRLVELLPGADPPVGFEQQVITALAPPPRARRWWVPAAAVVLVIAFAAGGWTLGRAYHDVPSPETDAQAGVRTVMFTPLSAGDRQVGQAYVYPGRPSWIYLSLDTDNDAASGTVRCELVHRDGSTVPLGTFTLAKGYGAWGVPAAIDRQTLAAIRLINDSGYTLATAQFTIGRTSTTPPVPLPVLVPDEHNSAVQTAPPQQPPSHRTPPHPYDPDHRERPGRGVGADRPSAPTDGRSAVHGR